MAAAAEGAALVCALPLEEVAAFSSLRINLSQDLRGADQRRANLQVRLCEQVCRGVFILGPDDFPLLLLPSFSPSSGRARAILNSQSMLLDACLQAAANLAWRLLSAVVTCVPKVEAPNREWLRVHKPCLIVVVLRLAECSMLQMVAEVERRFSEGVPLLDPAKDMGIKDSDFRKAIRYLLQHASWGCVC